MANANDSAIISEMLSCQSELMAEFFTRNAHKIADDATYWSVLGTLWKDGGTVVQQELWKKLFQSDRSKKHKIMKGRERRQWRKLPKSIIAYRAINNEREIETAVSWTLSRDIANRVFSENGKRMVVSRVFDKTEVFAFFDRRQEQEIIVNIQ